MKSPHYEQICAELYQIIGVLADHFNVFDHPDIIRALDRASGREIDGDLLPWPREPLPLLS